MNTSQQEDKNEEYELVISEQDGHATPKKREAKRTGYTSSWYYVSFVGQLGFAIAIPIAGGALLGTYLDRIWSTYPKATLSLLFLGILISVVGFFNTVMEIIRKK